MYTHYALNTLSVIHIYTLLFNKSVRLYISSATLDNEEFKYARKHNCPNFITFSSNNWDPIQAFKAFKEVFTNFHFEGGRHSTRIQKMIHSDFN